MPKASLFECSLCGNFFVLELFLQQNSQQDVLLVRDSLSVARVTNSVEESLGGNLGVTLAERFRISQSELTT